MGGSYVGEVEGIDEGLEGVGHGGGGVGVDDQDFERHLGVVSCA